MASAPGLVKSLFARILRSVLIVVAIAALNFGIVHLAPGDVADVLAGESGAASPEFIADLRTRFGLDKPLWEQFVIYMAQIAQFDLGYSFRFSRPVAGLVFERLPAGESVLTACRGGGSPCQHRTARPSRRSFSGGGTIAWSC